MHNYHYLLIGLGIGLIIALVVYFWQLTSRKKKEKNHQEEIKALKNSLLEKMEIEASGIEKLKSENEELKRQNENLRITNAALVQKPGRAEIQRLSVYQAAIDKLIISSPGFGPAWQTALNEAEQVAEEVGNGAKSFFRKIFPKKNVSIIDSTTNKAISSDQEEK